MNSILGWLTHQWMEWKRKRNLKKKIKKLQKGDPFIYKH
jgi:hypothetical protein